MIAKCRAATQFSLFKMLSEPVQQTANTKEQHKNVQAIKGFGPMIARGQLQLKIFISINHTKKSKKLVLVIERQTQFLNVLHLQPVNVK